MLGEGVLGFAAADSASAEKAEAIAEISSDMIIAMVSFNLKVQCARFKIGLVYTSSLVNVSRVDLMSVVQTTLYFYYCCLLVPASR